MRTRYIVTYDICDPKRLRQIYKTMRGYGDHLQYSVFRCDLSDIKKIELIGTLGEIINHAEDQVLLINIGPPEGRGDSCINSIGRPYTSQKRRAIVV